MNSIKLTRVDNRYIHGQVNARMVREYKISCVLLISDQVASDPTMSQIYKSIAIGYRVEIMGINQAAQAWSTGAYENDNVMLLWGNIDDAYETYRAGLKFPFLIIGNAPSAIGRKQVDKTCFIDETDADELRALATAGVDVYFQAMSDTPKTTLPEALAKTGF